MTTGRLFDGRAAQDRPVLLTLEGDALAMLDPLDGGLERWPVAEITRADPDAPGPAVTLRRRREPGRLVVSDPDLLHRLHALNRALVGPRRWRSRHWFATIAALVVAVAAAGVLIDRAPSLLLPLVPIGLEREWSSGIEQAIALGDARCTGAEGQAALDRLDTTLSNAAGIAIAPHVVVLDNPAVNAFTLPDGRILVLRGLIRHVAGPDELSGVLAHELGHNLHRDPTREMLRRIELSMLARSLGWSSNLGGRLAALSYGRRAEARADASAIETLRAAGLRADGLARFLGSIETGRAADRFAFLSNHPTDADRVADLPHDTVGRVAMDAGQWRAVRRICDDQ